MPTKRTTKGSRQSSYANRVQPVKPAAMRSGYHPTGDYARDAQAYHAAAARQGMSRGKKAAIIIIAAIAAVIIGCGTAFALYVNHIDSQLKGTKSDQERMAIQDALGYETSLDKPFYMMLIGTDRRDYDENDKGPWRSDTNIVCRVDPLECQVSMISIPRDTKIDIKGHGTQKFNAAYAFDGAAGAIKEAENLLDVDITHYAEVSFTKLADLVDAVGGVTVENESKIDNWKLDDGGDGEHHVIEEGTQHLMGQEALAFARNRDYPDGDFTRTKHQRQVIEAIVDSVLAMPVTGIPGVIEAAIGCVETDLNLLDLVGLAQKLADSGKELVIYSAMLPSYTQNINGISFVINDEELTAEMLKIFKQGGDISEDFTSSKTGKDVVDSSIDTSNVLILKGDEETERGLQVNTNTNTIDSGGVIETPTPDEGTDDSTGSTGGTSGSNSGSSSSGGNEGGGTTPSTPVTPEPTPDPTPEPTPDPTPEPTPEPTPSPGGSEAAAAA